MIRVMKKKEEEGKKIANVLKLAFICILVVIITLFLRNWYLKNDEAQRSTPILLDVLTHQIKENELYNYINDANTALIYMCVSSEDKCREVEREMKPFIQKNSLEDIIIYLDLKGVSKLDDFYHELNATYGYEPEISGYPSLIYFENDAIRNVLSEDDLTIQNLEEFMKGIHLLS